MSYNIVKEKLNNTKYGGDNTGSLFQDREKAN